MFDVPVSILDRVRSEFVDSLVDLGGLGGFVCGSLNEEIDRDQANHMWGHGYCGSSDVTGQQHSFPCCLAGSSSPTSRKVPNVNGRRPFDPNESHSVKSAQSSMSVAGWLTRLFKLALARCRHKLPCSVCRTLFPLSPFALNHPPPSQLFRELRVPSSAPTRVR